MRVEAPRNGVSMAELAVMFPDEGAARRWFEELQWPDGKRTCPNCGSGNTHDCAHETMPYRCRSCRRYFSVRTGTVMAGSPLPLLTWAYAIHLDAAFPDGASSMALHRDLGITQKSAWHLQKRIRGGFETTSAAGGGSRRPGRSGRKSKAERRDTGRIRP